MYNLTKISIHVKSDVPIILNQLGVPKSTVDNFDKYLSRVVNFLFLIHLSMNLYKDTKPLLKKVFKLTDDKVELEKEYTLKSDKLEPVKYEFRQAADYQEEFKGDNNKMENEIEQNFKELEDNTKVDAAEESAKEELQEEFEESENEIGQGEKLGEGEIIGEGGFLDEAMILL